MKLYHSRYILPALAAFLALVTLPVWRGTAARGSRLPEPAQSPGTTVH